MERRLVAVTRSIAAEIRVSYIYCYKIGGSVIQVRTSVPGSKFSDTDISDFVSAVMEDAVGGLSAGRW